MRKVLALAAALALVAGLAYAELGFRSVSATTTSQYFAVGTSGLTVVNDGASSAYVRIFWEDETVTDANGNYLAATSSNALIKSGESLEFSRTLQIKGIAIVSASTSTVRLFYW